MTINLVLVVLAALLPTSSQHSIEGARGRRPSGRAEVLPARHAVIFGQPARTFARG
jgi:hypothetical protein